MTVAEARWFDAKLTRLEQHGAGVWAIDEAHALTAPQRGWLEGRAATIAASLAPADRETIRTAVARFFLRWPNVAKGDTDARRETYVRELAAFPMWAIVEGMKSLGGDFLPASPVVAAACQERVTAARGEAIRINRLLSAQTYHVPSQAERDASIERVKALVREFHRDCALEAPAFMPGRKAHPLVRVDFLPISATNSEAVERDNALQPLDRDSATTEKWPAI